MKIRLHILAALAAAPLSFQALADCAAVETAPAAAQTAAPAAAAQVATAPEPAAVAASAPVATAAPAAASAPKGTAVTLRSVALRDRPTSTSTGDAVATADKRVRLERSVNNGDGTWWYVTAAGLGGGWVMESELGGQQQ